MALAKRVKRHFSFTSKEKKEFTITTIIFTLIMFLYVWRVVDLTTLAGVGYIIGLAIISAGSLYAFIASAKSFAITRGYTATYSYWMTGQLGGLLLSFISYGLIPILFPGYITIQTIDRLRHGKVFPGENKYDIFAVLAFATVIPIFVSMMLLILFSLTKLQLFYFGAILNGFLAFFSLLPFVDNNGSHLFYMNRKKYFFLVILALVYLIILLTTSLLMVLGVILVVALLWYFFMRFVVSKLW